VNGGVTTSVTIIINPVPVLTINNNDLEICSNEPTDIELLSSVPGSTITILNVVASDIAVSGYSGIGTNYNSGDFVTDIIDNPTNQPQTVTYTFRTTAAGCTELSDKQTTVTVNPIPDAAANGLDICSGDVTSIIITNPNNVPFTTFSWIVQSVDPGIDTPAPGSGTLIAQVLTNSNSVPGSATYRITPEAIGCIGNFVDFVQTVNPGNTAFAGTDLEVCESTAGITINDAVIGGGADFPPAGGSYWEVVSGSGTLTDSLTISPTYNPAIGETGTVTLQLTAGDLSSCPDVVDYVNIELYPAAIVDAGSNQTICEGEDVLLSEATRSGSATIITWSGGAGSFTPNVNALNAIYIPDPSESGTSVRLYITSNDPVGPWI
jgi:hypothetical protein